MISSGGERAAPVRFRYSDLNEAARVCGGCAVYVISIALGRAHVVGNRLFSRLCGAPRWPWKRDRVQKHIRIRVDGTLHALVSFLDAQEE
jgi:hypothetical protein